MVSTFPAFAWYVLNGNFLNSPGMLSSVSSSVRYAPAVAGMLGRNLFFPVHLEIIPGNDEVYHPRASGTLLRDKIIHFLICFPLISALVAIHYVSHFSLLSPRLSGV